MGRNCTLNKGNNNVECSVPLEKQIAEGKLLNIEGLLFVADFNMDLLILQMTYNISPCLLFPHDV